MVSDAARKAVPASVEEQAPPEPYVPGSGDKLPAELRLVLGGYAGIAFGWFAGALACAAPAVFLLFFVDDVYLGDDWIGLLPWLVVMACLVCIGALKALEALLVHGRFSGLLRRPSDPRTATVTASKRGGRTLILDIIQERTVNQQPPVGQGIPRRGEAPVGLPAQTARREGERCRSR